MSRSISPHVVGVEVRVELLRELRRDAPHHVLRERGARDVVLRAVAAGPRLGVGDVGAADDRGPTVDGDLLVASRQTLPLADGIRDDARHRRPALDRRDGVVFPCRRVDAAHEPRQRGGDRPRLAERRQHLIDVAQE